MGGRTSFRKSYVQALGCGVGSFTSQHQHGYDLVPEVGIVPMLDQKLRCQIDGACHAVDMETGLIKQIENHYLCPAMNKITNSHKQQ
jgi:hypothetical protein